MQPAFEVAEQNRHSLDPLLIGQILQPLFLNHIGGHALLALFLCLQVQVLKLRVGKFQKITKFAQSMLLLRYTGLPQIAGKNCLLVMKRYQAGLPKT